MKWIKIGLLVVLVVLVGLALWWAVSNGQRAAQSKQILRDVEAMQQGFEYFKQDQGRYPAISQFEDANLMRTYLNNFPPQQFTSQTCTETYDYYNFFSDQYELRFCLPKAVQGWAAGWNQVTH